jgi:large subunit ribosomal protein L6
MSRIGKLPIHIPQGVTVTIDNENIVRVKGKLGELKQKVNKDITVKLENGELVISKPENSIDKQLNAYHGLYRSLIHNMVVGVSTGYKIEQELVGVGYRAEVKGQLLELSLGYSHDIVFQIPAEVKVEAKTEKRANPIITLSSHDKQLLGQVASKIRSLRKPEPYKGKGIRFVGEQVRRKAGKAASV